MKGNNTLRDYQNPPTVKLGDFLSNLKASNENGNGHHQDEPTKEVLEDGIGLDELDFSESKKSTNKKKRKRTSTLDHELKVDVVTKIFSGEAVKDLAKEVKFHQTTIRKWAKEPKVKKEALNILKERGIEVNYRQYNKGKKTARSETKTTSRSRTMIDHEYKLRAVIELMNGKSAYTLADELSVHFTTIFDWAKKPEYLKECIRLLLSGETASLPTMPEKTQRVEEFGIAVKVTELAKLHDMDFNEATLQTIGKDVRAIIPLSEVIKGRMDDDFDIAKAEIVEFED